MSSFSRQHYNKIADIIVTTRQALGSSEANDTCDRISRELSGMFADDNPAFSPDRFLQACGTPA